MTEQKRSDTPPDWSEAMALQGRYVAKQLDRLVREWQRKKEDKGDTEHHIVKLVLENHAMIDRALSSERSESKDTAVQELRNLLDAKRFNREMFRDDTEWADWAQSRCRHALGDGK